MLFLSFQATSSSIKVVTTSDGKTALCVNNKGMVVFTPGLGIQLATSFCPEWEHARPAAIVNIEKPIFVTWGFILTTAGFLLQFLSFPSSKTSAEMRKELKEFQRAEDMKRKINPHTGLPRSQKPK